MPGAQLFALFLLRSPILAATARWLDVGRTPQRADYVLVLGGDESSRPRTAAALVEAGLAKTVLLTRRSAAQNSAAQNSAAQNSAARADSPPEKDAGDNVVRDVLRRGGVADGDVMVLEPPVASTYDEALALAAFLTGCPDARVLVVTTKHHTRRAAWVFALVLADRHSRFPSFPRPRRISRRTTGGGRVQDSIRLPASTSSWDSITCATIRCQSSPLPAQSARGSPRCCIGGGGEVRGLRAKS